jgi:hypothetical protein
MPREPGHPSYRTAARMSAFGTKRTSNRFYIGPQPETATLRQYSRAEFLKQPHAIAGRSHDRLTQLIELNTTNQGKRMVSQSRRFAILSFAVIMLAVSPECSAEECDYKTCGALMARDGSVSWAVSGPRDYSPDTKRACAELNACVRRAKNNSAGRAATAPAAGSSSLNSSPNGLANLKPEPADKAKGTQPALKSAVHETFGNGIPNADRSNGRPTPCFAVAEILVPVDCSPRGPQ